MKEPVLKKVLIGFIVLGLAFLIIFFMTNPSSPKMTTTSDSSTTTTSQTQQTTSSTQAPQATTETPVTQDPNTPPSTSDQPTTSTIPQEAIGTWSGDSLQAVGVSVTITSDGNVTTTANFREEGQDNIQTSSAVITEVKTVAPNTYFIISYTGSLEALLPGITGHGGYGVAKPGFKIENGQYTPILTGALTEEEINYQEYNDFGFSLPKQ